MFDDPNPNEIENWVCVMERGSPYEIESAKNYLSNLEIPSNILSKRDSSFSLNIGDTAHVYLYVPKEFEEQAREALEEMETPDDQKE
jgi:hypothetical protein